MNHDNLIPTDGCDERAYTGEPQVSKEMLTHEQGKLSAIATTLASMEDVPVGLVDVVSNASQWFEYAGNRIQQLLLIEQHLRDFLAMPIGNKKAMNYYANQGHHQAPAYTRGSSELHEYVVVLEQERAQLTDVRQCLSRLKVVAKAAQSGLSKERFSREDRKALAKELKELIEQLEATSK